MESLIERINQNPIEVNRLDNDALTDLIDHLNDAYRRGNALVSDYIYDHIIKPELSLRDPEHTLLHRVEPEPEDATGSNAAVRHQKPMLSTENGFNRNAIEIFVQRIIKACADNGIDTFTFRATPKLDGWSGNDVDGVLATRGNGLKGSNISHAFDRGVAVIGGLRNQGPGEIIVDAKYFADNLADEFPSSRNFLAGVINSDSPSDAAQKALDDGACHFVPYTTLDCWKGTADDFLADYEAICDNIQLSCQYETDGVILEVVEDNLKSLLGSTSHHHRWMLAVKLQRETSHRTVTSIEWATGRSGVVTPIIHYEGGMLSGGNLTKATGHNAKRIFWSRVIRLAQAK